MQVPPIPERLAQVGESMLSQAGKRNPLEETGRDDLVGIDVVAMQRDGCTGEVSL